jgi:hypothetical protein
MSTLIIQQPGSIALAMPETATLDEWLDVGKALAVQHKNLNWLVGDWALHGQTHFPEQFALALPEISDDPKTIKAIASVAKAFPPARRDMSLTYAHHASVADMPADEAMGMLKKAKVAKLTAKQLKVEASVRKIEIGQTVIWDDKDIDYAELMAVVRAWNCAQPRIREQFLDMAHASKLGIVEA